jgi:hypothetical protein
MQSLQDQQQVKTLRLRLECDNENVVNATEKVEELVLSFGLVASFKCDANKTQVLRGANVYVMYCFRCDAEKAYEEITKKLDPRCECVRKVEWAKKNSRGILYKSHPLFQQIASLEKEQRLAEKRYFSTLIYEVKALMVVEGKEDEKFKLLFKWVSCTELCNFYLLSLLRISLTLFVSLLSARFL